jgi:hypothetical protein
LREAVEKVDLIISTRLVEYLSNSESVGDFQRIPEHETEVGRQVVDIIIGAPVRGRLLT